MKKKQWLSILLSLSLLLTLLPAQAFAEEGADETESICTGEADCPAQVHKPDCPLWQEDSTGSDETIPGEIDLDETVPGETSSGETGLDETDSDETGTDETEPEETQPTAAEVLALIAALPDPGAVTAENAEAAETQLRELLALYQALDADRQEEVGDAILPAIELKAALDALSGEDNSPALLAEIATDVEYINAAYDETTNTVTYKKEIAASATVVDEDTTTWDAGWYVVQDTVTISDRITVSGDVHLILEDGAKLTASAGIGVNTASNSLTIYGQKSGTGELVAGTADTYHAGIGGHGTDASNPGTSGPITINGGIVTASGGKGGAGIGGGRNGSGSNITINGGIVTATGGEFSAGIGSGYGIPTSPTTASNIAIHGGIVNATGGASGAGIGGGQRGSVNGITITGGTVNATGGQYGAGIGGGINGNASNITIIGGFVTAKGGTAGTNYGTGAAIGSGGTSGSSSVGAEANESNFTNAVVLR